MSQQITIEEIDTTEDTGESVFRVEQGEAWMVFMFPREKPHDLWVHVIHSPEAGGMKAMMDYVCEEYDCRTVRFVNILNENLKRVLDGFESVEETVPESHPLEGDFMVCLDGEWVVSGQEAER